MGREGERPSNTLLCRLAVWKRWEEEDERDGALVPHPSLCVREDTGNDTFRVISRSWVLEERESNQVTCCCVARSCTTLVLRRTGRVEEVGGGGRAGQGACDPSRLVCARESREQHARCRSRCVPVERGGDRPGDTLLCCPAPQTEWKEEHRRDGALLPRPALRVREMAGNDT